MICRCGSRGPGGCPDQPAPARQTLLYAATDSLEADTVDHLLQWNQWTNDLIHSTAWWIVSAELYWSPTPTTQPRPEVDPLHLESFQLPRLLYTDLIAQIRHNLRIFATPPAT